MKKYFLLTIFALVLVLAPNSSVLASNRYEIPPQILYWGKMTQATNYEVGSCKENSGADWQQLADGTWAPPGDSLNTCQTGGLGGLTSNSLLDPWYRQGLGNQTNTLTGGYLNQSGYYPWGTNYPGNYSDYNDWFKNCVLMQSLVARPECQIYPRSGYFWPINQPWGSYSGDDSLYASYSSYGDNSSTYISASGDLGDLILGALLGYGLNQILN
ncbi:MAG: hypothetical protein BWY43_00258 [candidate division WS2 bacterium ADurb.Bin280]|uniref:Fibrobacter succinogenes major paralogous domain-containing protein n=1 Tax=candidate division WS2 bacterium ADurb.Bin280 TaxID=1852829 RepID=A0A1V5SEK7_9BACT|nr:MAG: hypothetical protein BWY43_00258 [candidate division WS2 bacterium ADurb.Bin280]